MSPTPSREPAAPGAPSPASAQAPPTGALRLALIVPCFDEEAMIGETIRRLEQLLADLSSEGLIAATSTVHFVDDGSQDGTWRLVEEAAARLPWVHGLKLSRNRGHQNALMAGLLEVDGDAVVSVDADLQDDLSAIRDMVRLHAAGAEIVYGVRSRRPSDSLFKRLTAESYYRLLGACGIDVVFNHADYRLIGRRALLGLREFTEVNLFVRGLIPLLGFHAERVYYDRAERFAGESKYPLKRMLALAWDGITSFSTLPLRWIALLGFAVSVLSFMVGAWAVLVRLFTPDAVPGWASTLIPVAFLGGIQLLSLGVIGEYVGKIYAETKRRPRYIIEKVI